MEQIVSTLDFSEGQTNILGLDDPEAFYCRVHSYRQGHSILIVSLVDKRSTVFDPKYLVFETVQYFEGHMWWEGANLCLKKFEVYINPNEISNPVQYPMPMFVFLSGIIETKIWSGRTITITDTLLME